MYCQFCGGECFRAKVPIRKIKVFYLRRKQKWICQEFPDGCRDCLRDDIMHESHGRCGVCAYHYKKSRLLDSISTK